MKHISEQQLQEATSFEERKKLIDSKWEVGEVDFFLGITMEINNKLVELMESLLEMPACCNTDPEVIENMSRRELARQFLLDNNLIKDDLTIIKS